MAIETKNDLITHLKTIKAPSSTSIYFFANKNGDYFASGNGGLGTRMFLQISKSNNLNQYLEELEKDKLIIRGVFKSIYEMGFEELSELSLAKPQA